MQIEGKGKEWEEILKLTRRGRMRVKWKFKAIENEIHRKVLTFMSEFLHRKNRSSLIYKLFLKSSTTSFTWIQLFFARNKSPLLSFPRIKGNMNIDCHSPPQNSSVPFHSQFFLFMNHSAWNIYLKSLLLHVVNH